jgi:hypothetical protein
MNHPTRSFIDRRVCRTDSQLVIYQSPRTLAKEAFYPETDVS